jgi:glyoxylase-like metal-dependent hydrolase (beta-lactamase superfamily II)
LDRFVYVYLILGEEKVVVVDSGVSGSEAAIADYLGSQGRSLEEVSLLILTHSHPDHIGAARAVRRLSGCAVAAHPLEKEWIEDTSRQCRERPVPGFERLVEGPVAVDRILEEGDCLRLDAGTTLVVRHTPGHSRGSISLLHEGDRALICGDAVPVPHAMPIYDDVAASVRTLRLLKGIADVQLLLSSWDDPRRGEEIPAVLDAALDFLLRLHGLVLRKAAEEKTMDSTAWAASILRDAGITGVVPNPLVIRSLEAHLREGFLTLTR